MNPVRPAGQNSNPHEIQYNLATWLESVAPKILGCDQCTPQIHVDQQIIRPKAAISFYRLECTHHKVRCCVKQFTHANTEELAKLYRKGQMIQPLLGGLAISTPHFLGFNSELKSIAMGFAQGEPLEDLIVTSFFRGKAFRKYCTTAIERLAKIQARLHSTPIRDDMPMAKPCSNSEYVRRYHELHVGEFANECLTIDAKSPQRVLDSLPAQFWDRHEKCLLHGDFQAKNVLVSNDEEISLIDLSFGYGHPLFDVAQFLIQLERLHRRWRLPHVQNLVRAYGEVFLSTFYGQGFNHLREDLAFFMLWSTTHSLIDDAKHSWPARAYIRHYVRSSGLSDYWCSV